ncbi:hypothetical protein HMPREF0872_05445 [Veillonella montpellierensis DNF00314]|uniref:Uncharacterized protein n=1 Tax=Veillonella montpellierensis DNF00314 TaxID=1401067 RepID=A0A096CPS0_9FIRM|nr:hypothetical protein HMPREF0872_05445 [Veillonella montpellierensis DNF00314]
MNVDDCVVNKFLNDLAKEIFNHFPQLYIEFSSSDNSLKLFTFLTNSIPYNNDIYKMKTKKVKVYVAALLITL